MSKILITGGHLTPALAFIDYCLTLTHPPEIIFAGRQYAQPANAQLSWEESEITTRGLKFISFNAPKSHHFNPLDFYHSYLQALEILTTQKITHLLSFGGYLALPFALAAAKLKLPLITHEQTRILGKANRLMSFWAYQIATSFPETKTLFPQKTTVTGNPLRSQIFDSAAPAPAWFTPHSRPLLYLAGGSQGSRIINQNLLPILWQLAPDYTIIHQVGRDSDKFHPLKEINAYLKKNQLSLPHYYPREFLSASELAYFLPRFHLAVSRAGANTVAELTAFRLPTLYIPLPHANYQEQYRNAHALVKKDAALILPQKHLTPISLLESIHTLSQRQSELKTNLAQFTLDQRASARLLKLLQTHPPRHARSRLKSTKSG